MMRSAEDLLQELTALDESHRIEAKLARQIDRSVMETVCAFANEPGLGGGYLLLGVTRDTHDLFSSTYQIDGIDNPEKLQSDLASQCASVFNRPLRPRVSVEVLSGKTVVVIYVPEAAPTEKPIFLQNLGLPRGAFRRIGPTDQEGFVPTTRETNFLSISVDETKRLNSDEVAGGRSPEGSVA